MPLLGFIWVTSWVSCFLASHQGFLKVPDYLASVFPARVFSVVSSPIEIPTPLFQTPLPSRASSSNSSVAAIPNLAFQVSTGSFPFQPQQAQAAVRHPFHSAQEKGVFCRPESEQNKDSVPVTTVPSASSHSSQETSPDDVSKATLPQQILQVVQNLFSWGQRVEPLGKTVASSVMVVSSHSSEQVGEKQNDKQRRAKRGLWRYAQLLSRQAFAADSSTENTTREQFQVWIKERLIAQVPYQHQAERMAQRLKQVFSNLYDSDLNTLSIEAAVLEGVPVVKVGDRILFKIDEALAKDLGRNEELLAIEWANNLRTALRKEPLQLAEAQRRMYNLVETQNTFEGLASWYAPYFHGRLTATGETYNQRELTAAHPSLPFDTYLKVKNLENGESVIVRINDRGPYVPDKNRNLDLSREAARCIKSEEAGIVPFEAVIMRSPSNW
ncbi:MAG: septal ring lytic transglycosylase RlpA family protein [Coleofasciculus sp. S288]|nr:septal ring lytic transglycosylase RlpA family protein [Coleofasciculus sp. S288]